MPSDVLIFIHGMVSEVEPTAPELDYERFWAGLATLRPELHGLVRRRIHVRWGHERPGSGCRK